jgi:hypothetical protein
VVSVTDPYGCILDLIYLDKYIYFSCLWSVLTDYDVDKASSNRYYLLNRKSRGNGNEGPRVLDLDCSQQSAVSRYKLGDSIEG